jgi:hypothetical protein
MTQDLAGARLDAAHYQRLLELCRDDWRLGAMAAHHMLHGDLAKEGLRRDQGLRAAMWLKIVWDISDATSRRTMFFCLPMKMCRKWCSKVSARLGPVDCNHSTIPALSSTSTNQSSVHARWVAPSSRLIN